MALSPEEEKELELLKQEAAKLANPKLITTREQALKAAMEVDGAIEEPMFAPDDLIGAGLIKAPAKLVKGAANALIKKPLEKAAQKQGMIDMVKTGSGLEPWAREQVSGAAELLNKQIGAGDQKLRQLLKGTKGEINPDIVEPVFPNYAKKLSSSKPTEKVPVPKTLTKEMQQEIPLEGFAPEMVTQPVAQGRAALSGEQLLRLKRGADKAAKYSFSDAMNPQVVAKAKEAKLVADAARRQIKEIAPDSEEVLGQMGADIRLKNFLNRRGQRNPVSTITGKPGSMKDSIVAQIDQRTGGSLRKAGEQLGDAKNSLINPSDFISLRAPTTVAKVGKRAAIGAGSALNKGADAVLNNKVGKLASEAGAHAIGMEALHDVAQLPVQTPAAPNWTDEDEAELNELKSLLEQMQKNR